MKAPSLIFSFSVCQLQMEGAKRNQTNLGHATPRCGTKSIIIKELRQRLVNDIQNLIIGQIETGQLKLLNRNQTKLGHATTRCGTKVLSLKYCLKG